MVDTLATTCKKVELRSQYLKQLKEIQNLKDEGVLTLEEFQAEDTILQTLKGFNTRTYNSHSYTIHIRTVYCVQSDVLYPESRLGLDKLCWHNFENNRIENFAGIMGKNLGYNFM